MTIEIPDKIYRPCSTCNDDTCVFYGGKDTHEICVDYKDKRLDKAKTNIEIMLEQEKQKDGTYTDVGQGIAIALGLINNEIGE